MVVFLCLLEARHATEIDLSEKQHAQALAASIAELEASRQKLATTSQDLDANKQELVSTRQELDVSKQDLDTGKQELTASRQELEATKQELSKLEERIQELQQQHTLALSELQTCHETSLASALTALREQMDQEHRGRLDASLRRQLLKVETTVLSPASSSLAASPAVGQRHRGHAAFRCISQQYNFISTP